MENIIDKLSKELNVNQVELSRISGYSEEAISRWKKDPSKMKKGAINHLDLLLNCEKRKDNKKY